MNYLKLKDKTTIISSDKNEIESSMSTKSQIISYNLARLVTNRIFFILLFGLFLSLNNYAQEKTNQQVDLSSVDYFFVIKDKISFNKSINEEDWNRLFSTSGYKISTTSSVRKKIIREMMLAAYNPKFIFKKDSVLNSSIEENIKNPYVLLYKMTLLNFIDYSTKEKKLKDFRKKYDFSLISEYSTKRLKNFLTNPIDSLINIPIINFLCYEPDAQSKPKGIICDFNLFFKESQEERINFIAHETFHQYRRNFIDNKFIESNAVIQEIDKLQDEGIADLIDKKENLLESISDKGLPEVFVKQYFGAYQNTPEILKEFDITIVSWLHNQINEEQFKSKINHYFLSGGHPNGYFMARLIEKAGLKKEMLDKFYSPVDFIKTYNQAAKLENSYIFSEEFIHYIDNLK
jgi:hypothetical protein